VKLNPSGIFNNPEPSDGTTRRLVLLGLSLLQLGLSQAEVSAQQRSAGPNSATFPAPVDSLYSRANANPWFSDLEVRRNLRLSNEQYRDLNDGYHLTWQAYQQDLANLGTNLNQQTRNQLQQELFDSFNQSLAQTAADVLQSPALRQRYDQLYLQHRVFGALCDPIVRQALNLSQKQYLQFETYDRAWTQNVVILSRTYLADRARTTSRFYTLQQEAQERINLTLSQPQEAAWRKMTGRTYTFQPDTYLSAGR
jgi:hypothetical protein